jgi:hypothetical protein
MIGMQVDTRHRGAWWMVTLILGSGVLAAGWPSASAAGSSAPTRDDLTRALAQLQEITNQYFDHPRATRVQEYIADQHAVIRGLVKTAPEARRIAQVIFRRGLSARQLEAMQREFRLSIHDVEVVFVAGNQSEFARTLPPQLIWGSTKPLADTLGKFVEDHLALLKSRVAEMRRTSSAADGQRVAEYEEMVKSVKPLLVRVRVTATADLLRLVSEEPDVYAVVMNPSAESARRLEEARSQMENTSAIRDVTDL